MMTELNLQLLTPQQIPLLQDFLERFPRQSCDYTVTNMLTWGRLYQIQYLLWQDNLIIYNPKYHAICFPVGNSFHAADLAELVKSFQEQFDHATLILIPDDWETSFPGLGGCFHIWEDRDWVDYVYASEDLALLKGKKLAKKKNLISQYIRQYPDYHVLPINAGHKEVILSFATKWKRERNADGIHLNSEMQALQYTMEQWDILPVQGYIICHQNKISAFSIFSRQTPDMATIHYEKYNPDMKGAAQLVNWEVARIIHQNYRWINREQDMGLEGLRRAKESYDPAYLVSFRSGLLTA